MTPRKKITSRTRDLVFKMDRYRCARCGRTSGQLDIDHKLPLALGGTNAIENLQVLCSPCNNAKGAYTG